MSDFKIDGNINNMLDNFEKLITEIRKLDFAESNLCTNTTIYR